MAIAFDAASNSGEQIAQSTYSWAHTCTGADRYLVVGVSLPSEVGASVTGITYNGVALGLLVAHQSAGAPIRSELWGLAAPATGSNQIAVTVSASLTTMSGGLSFTGVAQTGSTEAPNSADGINTGVANDATVTVTTLTDNAWVVDTVVTDDTSISAGAGQTARWNVTGTSGSGAGSHEGPKTPAGAVVMSWTGVGTINSWSTVAVALKPQAAVPDYVSTGFETPRWPRPPHGLFGLSLCVVPFNPIPAAADLTATTVAGSASCAVVASGMTPPGGGT